MVDRRWIASALSVAALAAVHMAAPAARSSIEYLAVPLVEASGGCVTSTYIDGAVSFARTPEEALDGLPNLPSLVRWSASPHEVWFVHKVDGRIESAYLVGGSVDGRWRVARLIRPGPCGGGSLFP